MPFDLGLGRFWIQRMTQRDCTCMHRFGYRFFDDTHATSLVAVMISPEDGEGMSPPLDAAVAGYEQRHHDESLGATQRRRL